MSPEEKIRNFETMIKAEFAVLKNNTAFQRELDKIQDGISNKIEHSKKEIKELETTIKELKNRK